MNQSAAPRRRVGLFVTCLANVARPQVAEAAVRLLQHAGCEVEVPANQSCCGQPGYNNGAVQATRAVARQLIATFEDYPHVVLPSGSCAGMLVHHYPRLFEDEPAWQARAQALAARTHELTQFLVDVCGYVPPAALGDGQRLTYHDSCAGLRELGIAEQPRRLLRQACGAQIEEMEQREVCCGFGGSFSVKQADISVRMADEKLSNCQRTGAPLLVGGDLGCLLHLGGRASRLGLDLEVRHVAEVLAERIGPAEESE
jgi:L-lactate dehydrogenase complex protein LldE